MKLKILFILIALVCAIPSFAQKHNGGKESDAKKKEMLEFKLKFLADEIELKDDQKKKFDQIYSQMDQERRAIFKKIKAAEKKISDNKNASEADYEKAYKEIADAKAELALVEKKYDEKFATFLSKKQIYKLKDAEVKFMDIVKSCRDKKKREKK